MEKCVTHVVGQKCYPCSRLLRVRGNRRRNFYQMRRIISASSPSPSHCYAMGPSLVSGNCRRILFKDRRSEGPGGRQAPRSAMSPVHPPATTVGELGIFAVLTHDRKVAGSQTQEQGRLP